MSKYDDDAKLHEYEKTIFESGEKKKGIEAQLDVLKENMAVLLFEFSQNLDPGKERLILEKAEEEKQLQEELNKVLKDQRKAMLQWRKRLSVHYEKGHKVTKSIILPTVGVGAMSFVDSGWEGKIIPFEHITFYKDKKLGEGAFGTVYRGMVYGNVVAIKRLKEPVSTEGVNAEVSRSNATNSFENEIQLLAGLKHENILKFMGASFIDKDEEEKDGPKFLNCCILTEYAERGSLHDILYTPARDGNLRVKFTLTRKYTVIDQIVKGMNQLHSHNVVHLDLKPANILLDAEYNARIADFGMSKISTSFQSALQTFIGGTPYYMAPEILLADDPSGPKVPPSTKSDVYSFGILLNEFLTEEPPYCEMLGDKPTIDRLKKIVSSDKQNRPFLYKEKQEEIKNLIKSCWEFNPDDRMSFPAILKESAWTKARQSLVDDSLSTGKKIQIKVEKEAKDSKIKVEDFVKIFKEHHSLDTELHKGCANNQAAIDLFLDIPNRVTYPEVELSKIYRFLTWFEGYRSNEIIPTIQEVIKTKWFFGVLDSEKAVDILSKKENNHTGTYLVRWDNEQFILSYIYSDKEKGNQKKVIHKETGHKNLRELFENEKIWKKDLKSTQFPERPLAYRDLVGKWFQASYISSGTSYTLKIDGVSPAAPTQQEQLNQQRGLPSFDMVL